MPLAPGQTLAHYEILGPLGAGGMGEVHRAKDTRLQREVAIKVLPDSLATDEDRLRRFEREAKVLASLNHANVAQIFGVDQVGDLSFLVLELVPGENLAERVARGPLPVEEALEVCRQIAEALEAAHEAGVIHRDLKPANVRITPQGVVKVLDFGLAKSVKPRASKSGTSAAESDSFALTEEGLVLGTPTYMSPEQARGKPVDRRTDVWAFGCVLHECLTGKRLFGGESVGDVLASILHGEPDGSLLPASTPPRVRELLARCLVKDPRQRLRDIGDARLELEKAIAAREWTAAGSPAVAGRGTSHPGRGPRLGLGVAALLLAGAAAGWWMAGRASTRAIPAPAQVFHLSVPLPAESRFGGLVAIAPDASYLVYRVSSEKQPEGSTLGGILTTRWLDRDETRAIEGTEDAISAALSADGRWLAFTTEKDQGSYAITLKKVAIENGRQAGPPTTVCERIAGWATVCWASDQELVLAAGVPEGQILAVPAKGGEPRVVAREAAEKDKGVRGWWQPQPLPGGQAVVATRFEAEGGTFRQSIEAVDLATGERKTVLEKASGAQYVSSGHLLALRDQALVAAPFDLSRRETTGGTVAVLGAATDQWMDPSFAASRTGVLAMVPQPPGGAQRRLAWIDAQGHAAPIEGPTRPYAWVAISRDGQRVAYGILDPSQSEPPRDFWVLDIERHTTSRLATSEFLSHAIWSPDGARVTFSTGNVTTSPGIGERRADGTDEPRSLYVLPETRVWLEPLAWTPDGKVLAFTRQEFTAAREQFDLWMLQRGESGSEPIATRYLTTRAVRPEVLFSPDGRWIGYGASESGRQELHVQPFTGPGSGAEDAKAGRWRISTNGGRSPWWSQDGKEIRYVDDDGRVMSVQVQTEPSFSVSSPKLLFGLKDLKIFGAPKFTADGRLMAVLQGEGGEITRIDVVLGFFEELKAKAPVPGR